MDIAGPVWAIPQNIEAIIKTEELWGDDRWSPILLTILGGTSYKGRKIPLSWQIEFEPIGDVFENSNKRIASLGAEPDGYGWANVIRSVAAKHHPDIVDELQFGDTDQNACVIWVESENSCKILMQIAWALIKNT